MKTKTYTYDAALQAFFAPGSGFAIDTAQLMLEHLNALLVELEKTRKDTARLDWLDSHGGNLQIVELIPWEEDTNTVVPSTYGDIREAVDRAINTSAPPQGDNTP